MPGRWPVRYTLLLAGEREGERYTSRETELEVSTLRVVTPVELRPQVLTKGSLLPSPLLLYRFWHDGLELLGPLPKVLIPIGRRSCCGARFGCATWIACQTGANPPLLAAVARGRPRQARRAIRRSRPPIPATDWLFLVVVAFGGGLLCAAQPTSQRHCADVANVFCNAPPTCHMLPSRPGGRRWQSTYDVRRCTGSILRRDEPVRGVTAVVSRRIVFCFALSQVAEGVVWPRPLLLRVS